MPETVFDHLQQSLTAATRFNHGQQVAPAVLLWPDPDRQWQPAARCLRRHWPHLLTLGEFDPAQKTGPAIWLKCMLAGSLPEADWPDGELPVIYMPGVSRHDLRAVEDCPPALQPLAELQYRGVFWGQLNGRDWSLLAFLSSANGGLGLDVSRDRATAAALLRALPPLLDCEIATLRGRRLDALDFDALLSPDPVRDLLSWLDQPEQMQQQWAGARWQAFAGQCREHYRFDPVDDGVLAAAQRLAEGGPGWELPWQRLAESVSGYPGLVERLHALSPQDLLADPARYPRINAEREDALRDALTGLQTLTPAAAQAALLALEADHAERRDWLWAARGDAPLATALAPLAALCEAVQQSASGGDPQALGQAYADHGWRIDEQALLALAAIHSNADLKAVEAALHAVYVPWLSELARAFQQAVRAKGYPGLGFDISDTRGDYAPAGECVLFVDGLRLDAAHRLSGALTDAGCNVSLGRGWSPFPSVTASRKAWVSPVATQVSGRTTDRDFAPGLATADQPLNAHQFRKLLDQAGWQVLKGFDSGDPSGRAWAEFGDLDHYGHQHGLRLAKEIDPVCTRLTERIQGLFATGWQRVTVVTDHGWLLVPGTLPKVKLDKHLTDTRWGRCALMKHGAAAPGPMLNWSWCAELSVASAPGIASHIAGQHYAHGGLSLQECVVPVLDIQAGSNAAVARAAIATLKWVGLRCRVVIDDPQPGLQVDIRSKAGDPGSSFCAGPKPVKAGKASIAVPDDQHEGSAAVVVLLDAQGRPLDQYSTVIGA